MRSALTALFCLLPTPLARCALAIFGHRVHRTAKIGFSLVAVPKLYLGPNAVIGHFNLIRCRRVVLRRKARILHMNVIVGPFSVALGEDSKIGTRNRVRRSPLGVTYGPSMFRMGVISGLTIGHSVDLTRSVIFGDYCTAAGMGSQFWTHGYYHEEHGVGRFRVDGRIVIGNNVYIGSGSIVTMGVQIADGVMVGSLSSVSKSLNKRGLYVSQPLRFIELDTQKTMEKLEKVAGHTLEEIVYRKKEV